MKASRGVLATALLALILPAAGRATAADGFDVVALGALGGIQDGNLSAWLIHPHGDVRAVTCDAGTLVNGLRVADGKGAFADLKIPAGAAGQSRVGFLLTDRIKAYLVSHAHLDHVAGLIVSSPDDSKKPIYALASVNAALVTAYFNWQAWPNFSDRGKAPLKKFALEDLTPETLTPLKDTGMSVTAYPLSHGGVESTAFLIDSGDDALLCFGDTGPDAIEKGTKLKDIWAAVAGRVKQRRLKAIIIEASYTNDRPDNLLFGHLTPKWLLAALHELDQAAGGGALKGLPVVVSHVKYALTNEQPQKRVLQELEAGNDLGVRFVIPEQGNRWHFK